MKLWTRRVARCVGILALSAGVAVTASSPASAASPNFATAITLSGIIAAEPIVVSTFPGASSGHASELNLIDAPGWATGQVTGQPVPISGLPNLFTTGPVDTVAGPTSAASSLTNLALTVTPVLGIIGQSMSSSCFYDPNTHTVSGASQLVGTAVVGLSVPIPVTAPPNTIIAIPGIATITVNRQRFASDGTLTVDALSISVFGSLQTIAIGTSSCNRSTLA